MPTQRLFVPMLFVLPPAAVPLVVFARYPDGLRGDAIPLSARVVAVADAYSAMTTRRSYREPMTPGGAMRELHLHAGSQFDPAVVEAALLVLARDEHIEIPTTKAVDAA